VIHASEAEAQVCLRRPRSRWSAASLIAGRFGAKARSLRDKDIAATDIAKMLGISRATVYRYLADDAVA
jgi:DNA invertase Pin-like site-specific DNA recombinase